MRICRQVIPFIPSKRRRLFLILLIISILTLYLLKMADQNETSCDVDCLYPRQVWLQETPVSKNVTLKDEIGTLGDGKWTQKGQFRHPKFCAQPLQRVHGIQCEKIINGDHLYIKSLSSLKFTRGNDSCDLSLMLNNCSRFRNLNGYEMNRSSLEEEEFPIAFGIKMHKDPKQVEQLLRTIYRPQNVYCIHVDLKAEKSVRETVHKLGNCFENVFVLQEYRVVYSSIRQPLADIACMKKLLNTNVRWKYYIILAGQEFVLKTNLEIVKILKILNGTNDIETYPIPKSNAFRYKYRHPINETAGTILKYSNITKTPFPHNITFYKGSSYGMFSRKFIHFILESNISKELIQWANDVYAPEELIWCTLNGISGAPGGYKVSVQHQNREFLSRAMIWGWDKLKCQGQFVRSVCVFSYKDLPWLVSSPEIVANKFDLDFDPLAVDCLEEWIQNKTDLGTTINMNWYFYRNVPHVKVNSQ